jgi:hypothetical protein
MLVQLPLHLDCCPARPRPPTCTTRWPATTPDQHAANWVSVLPPTDDNKLAADTLANTNKLELRVFANEQYRQAVLIARLDNLGKGASGAAVQPDAGPVSRRFSFHSMPRAPTGRAAHRARAQALVPPLVLPGDMDPAARHGVLRRFILGFPFRISGFLPAAVGCRGCGVAGARVAAFQRFPQMTRKAPGAAGPEGSGDLQRNLTNRHIQLIAIGGAIGTGLFMGSGKTISLAGPSIVFVYAIIGVMLFFVMRAMGELLLSNLQYRSFIDFSADLLGPWAGFTGWTYWFCWIVTGIADVIAITAYAQFWFPTAAVGAGHCLRGRAAGPEPADGEAVRRDRVLVRHDQDRGHRGADRHGPVDGGQRALPRLRAQASLANLWNDGGMFPNGLMGFFAGFQIAVFAFVGIELVGTTAAEAKDPARCRAPSTRFPCASSSSTCWR